MGLPSHPINHIFQVGRNPNRSQSSFRTRHSCAPSVVKLEPILETPTTASHTRPTAPTPDKAKDSWISTRKFSVSSTSSRSTASKRRSVYDDECPRTPKAAKQELDTSSMRSKGSTRSIPFKRSVSLVSCLCLPFPRAENVLLLHVTHVLFLLIASVLPHVAPIFLMSPLSLHLCTDIRAVKGQYSPSSSCFAQQARGPSMPVSVLRRTISTAGRTGGTAGSLARTSSSLSLQARRTCRQAREILDRRLALRHILDITVSLELSLYVAPILLSFFVTPTLNLLVALAPTFVLSPLISSVYTIL